MRGKPQGIKATRLHHDLASCSLVPQVRRVYDWHINADEPRALDYNDYNQPLLDQPDEYKASDHDPVIVYLRLGDWVDLFLPTSYR